MSKKMKCNEARQLLYTYDDHELEMMELSRAREHLGRCPSCQEYFQQENRFKGFIHDRAPRELAPASLREEIFTQIARMKERQILKGRVSHLLFKRFLPAAAVFIMVILASIIYFQSETELQPIITALMEDHLKYNRGGTLLEFSSSSREDIENWFTGKVGFLVSLPEFRGSQLVGGRLCSIQDKPLALIFYEKDREKASLFVMEKARIDLTSLEKFYLADKTFSRHKGKGCNAIIWKERELAYVMVSELNEKRLLDMLIPG